MADDFTPTPVCSPARASSFTGRLPSQHGFQDYLMEVDMPELEGHQTDWCNEQFCEYGNADMLRPERYKLVRHYAPHAGVYPDELYDLIDDPRESSNRISDPQLAGIVSSLDARLEDHFTGYEQPERSAKHILSQPRCNRVEPWRMERTSASG